MIRGTYYGYISQDDMDEECFYLAERAVATFKFPRISTDYTVFYATRNDDGELTVIEDDSSDDDGVPHAYFNAELTSAEIDILVA